VLPGPSSFRPMEEESEPAHDWPTMSVGDGSACRSCVSSGAGPGNAVLGGDNEPVVEDGTEHPDSVTECAQMADAINPGAFETRNLGHDKARGRDTDVDERLDFKAIAPETPAFVGRRDSRGTESQDRKMFLPEGIEAVAQYPPRSPLGCLEPGLAPSQCRPSRDGHVLDGNCGDGYDSRPSRAIW
jgi:hypothetical protein